LSRPLKQLGNCLCRYPDCTAEPYDSQSTVQKAGQAPPPGLAVRKPAPDASGAHAAVRGRGITLRARNPANPGTFKGRATPGQRSKTVGGCVPPQPTLTKNLVISMNYGDLSFRMESRTNEISYLGGRFKSSRNQCIGRKPLFSLSANEGGQCPWQPSAVVACGGGCSLMATGLSA
jgi:hypothetical protein